MASFQCIANVDSALSEGGCHPERSEGSAVPVRGELMQILRFAQNDRLPSGESVIRGCDLFSERTGRSDRAGGVPFRLRLFLEKIPISK